MRGRISSLYSFALPLLFTALVFLLMPPSAYAALDPTDRAALVDLYNSTNGDSWTNSTGLNKKWDTGNPSSDPCTEWFGIICDASNPQRVQQIILNDNNLTGSISSTLGNLSNLLNLYLDNNSLTGAIPSTLGNLSNLLTLALYTNSLSGTIPSGLGNLSSIQNLVLYGNALTGEIPSELGNLTTLQKLYLDHNELCGEVPSSLTNLTSLDADTGLDLNNNNLITDVDTDLDNFIILKSNGWGTGDWKDTQNSKGCFSWPMYLPAITGGKK